MEPFELEFLGEVPAKKNSKTPFVGKDGKMGVHNDKEAQAAINVLALQVSSEYRDLNLQHPEVEFFFTVPNGCRDRDNMATTLLDVLVNMSVFRNDSIASFNGTLTVHPATISDHYHTRVVITPAVVSESGHGKRKKR